MKNDKNPTEDSDVTHDLDTMSYEPDHQTSHDDETLALPDDETPDPTKKDSSPAQSKKQSRFKETEKIGQGGMSTIIKVYDTQLKRYNANKIIRPKYRENNCILKRFVYEAQVTAQLEHPNIIPIHDYIDNKEELSIHMRLIEGENLSQILKNYGENRLSYITENLNVLHKILDAMGFAHSHGVVHRDLKPANIMVGKFGEVYVMDWGIVRNFEVPGLTDTDSIVKVPPELESFFQNETGVIGTPTYMPPEQANGHIDKIDARTDIFAIGALLYFMLTGHSPYAGNKSFEYAKKHLIQKPSSFEYIPKELLRIAMKAMSYKQDNRYQSAAEMQQAINGYLNGQVITSIDYKSGDIIFKEGDVGLSAYFIKKGKCLVYTNNGSKRKILRKMCPGELFGELAVISKKPRTASVEALSDVTLLEINNKTLKSGLGSNQWIGILLNSLVNRFLEAEEKNNFSS
jgi:eukaryotic-like serine/threonine-protein kinase